MNIFLVRTPLQYFNAIAAKKHFNINDNDAILLILYNHNKNTKDQMNYILKTNNTQWKQVIKLPYRNLISRVLELRKTLKSILDNRYNRIFVGDYSTGIYRDAVNKFPFDEVVLLDDGNMTISTYKDLITGEKNALDRRDNIIGKIIKKALKFDTMIVDKCKMFTVYNDLKSTKDITVIHNDYGCYKGEIEDKSIANYILFLGSPFIDLKKMSEIDYLDLLKSIQSVNKDIKIIYIPHRYEEEVNLNKIKALGYIVKKMNTSIEYEVLYGALGIPRKVICFSTSAAINLKLLLEGKNIDIMCIKPEIDKFIDATYRDKIEDVYDYLEKYVPVEEEKFIKTT